MSRLFIVSTELKPFVWRTGLSQIHGLAVALSRTGAWSRVTCVLPDYGGAAFRDEPDRGSHVIERYGPGGLRYAFLQADYLHEFGETTRKRRLTTRLPFDEELWAHFGEDVASFVADEVRGEGDFEVMAVDWPSGPALARLACMPKCTRAVMTLDIVPDEAKHIWWQGVEAADALHIPSEDWAERLMKRHPSLCSLAGRIQCIPFGLGGDALGPLVNPIVHKRHCYESVEDFKLEAKRELQEQLGLERLDEGMLFFARHRVTPDDQKNYLALYFAVEALLEASPRNQVVVSPLPPRDTRDVEFLLQAFTRLADRHGERLFVGLVDPFLLAVAADAQLFPSRFEPCGLLHLYGMAYGVVPVTSRTGAIQEFGLTDARGGVEGDSFVFDWGDVDPIRSTQHFLDAVLEAARIHAEEPETWRGIRQRAIQKTDDWTWRKLAGRYMSLFGVDRRDKERPQSLSA